MIKPDTYGTPLGFFGPTCPEMFFKPIESPVDAELVLDSARIVASRARGIAGLLATNADENCEQQLNDRDFQSGINALWAVLEQLDAVLSHLTSHRARS